jgi:broad specificity phosphatase PhoE
MECTVLLCRHGNTFAPGETPVMVGSQQDLELTVEGERQAVQVGLALLQSTLAIAQIISAPLRRTKKFADLVKEQLAPACVPSLHIDSRLSELDYGKWSGKSTLEIESTYGVNDLHSWNERGEWPKSVSFLPPREQVERELNSLLDEIIESRTNTCLVTSHGRIKVLADLLKLETPRKMGTGRVSVLKYSHRTWNNLGWNLTPSELNEVLVKLEK